MKLKRILGQKSYLESIIYLNNNYPNSSITLVSIPPPSNIYTWVYPIKIKDNSLNREKILNYETDMNKYDEIMEKIQIFAEKFKYNIYKLTK